MSPYIIPNAISNPAPETLFKFLATVLVQNLQTTNVYWNKLDKKIQNTYFKILFQQGNQVLLHIFDEGGNDEEISFNGMDMPLCVVDC